MPELLSSALNFFLISVNQNTHMIPYGPFIHSKDRLGTGIQSVGYSIPNFASLRRTDSWKQPLYITGHRARLSSTSHYCVKKEQSVLVCFQ